MFALSSFSVVISTLVSVKWVVKKAAKVSNRRDIQKASRKANRITRTRGVKLYPQCSLAVRDAQVSKANWDAKVRFYTPQPKVVVAFEKPILRVKKELPKPILKKDRVKVAAKVAKLPTILGALKEARKEYTGGGRTCVGKKYKVTTGRIRKSKSEAKKASKRKCLYAVLSNIEKVDSGIWDSLAEVAINLGYSISLKGISDFGQVDHQKKEIVINPMDEVLKPYILAHELVHVAAHMGKLDIFKGLMQRVINDPTPLAYWEEVKTAYAEDEEETYASFCMWSPLEVYFLMEELELATPPSTTEGAVIGQSVEGEPSTTTTMETDMIAELFRQFQALKTTAKLTTQLVEAAQEVFDAVSEVVNASEYDLMWLGIDCSNPKAFASWVKDYNGVIAAAKTLYAFHTVGCSVFPKEVFTKNVDFFQLGEFASYTQQLAVIKYCRDNGLAGKLVSLYEKQVTIGDDKVIIPSSESIPLEQSIYPLVDTNLNITVVLNALRNCKDNEALANFIVQFGNFTYIEGLTYQLHPHNTALTYGHIEVDFSNLTITTSREFLIRNKAFLTGYGEITGFQMLGLILLTIVGSNDDFWGQNYLDAYLNTITAIEEEQDLYGDQMDESQQLRLIRANSVAILTARPDSLRYPFFQLKNNNNAVGVSEATRYYLSQEIPFFVDKNAMKRVVLGAGVSALFASMDFQRGIMKTILDTSKVGKAFTRGWQTLCIPASQGIRGLQPYAVDHENSNLVITHHYPDGSTLDITIKGERALTLTGDANFLINGSGVGLGFKPWAASCKKTLPDSFNAMSLRNGETLEQVKAELTEALNKVLNDEKVRKSGTHLLNFRGRQLLSYKGLNQEFVTHSKYGCSFTIRELGTSKTLAITFTVVYFYTDYEAKVRGLGQKTVLKEAAKSGAQVLDSAYNVINLDALLGSECLKGNAARLIQYAEFCRTMLSKLGAEPEDYKVGLIGGHHPLAMEAFEGPELVEQDGVWTWTGNRSIQSLTDMASAFYKWWAQNTKTYYLSDTIAIYPFLWLLLGRAELQQEWTPGNTIDQALLEQALAHPNNAKVRMVNPDTGEVTTNLNDAQEHPGFLRVVEEFSGVLSHFVFQMELASIRECSNAGQASTIQQIGSVYCSNPVVGEALADGIYVKSVVGDKVEYGYAAVEQEQAVLGMVAMANNNFAIRKLQDTLPAPCSKIKELGLKDLVDLNASLMNGGANALYPVNKDPFLKFYNSKAGKKFQVSNLVNIVGLIDVKAGNVPFSVVEAIAGSAQNYSMNVGTGYNISSVATCMGVLARYAIVKGIRDKLSKQQLAELKEEFLIWGWVNTLAWKSGYENGWLASYNAEGKALAEALHRFRKGIEIDSSGNVIKTESEVLTELKKLLAAIEDISPERIRDSWVKKFLWAYRIARAVGVYEKKTKAPYIVMKDLNLIEEQDTLHIAICGAFRRCDQGRLSNNEDLLGNELEEGYGRSMWSLLQEHWDVASLMMPNWMQRKLGTAMNVHLIISDTAKVINNKVGRNNYQVDQDLASTVSYDDETDRVTLANSLDPATLVANSIPTIQFEYAHQDSPEQLYIPQKKGAGYVWETVDAKSHQGAFMHYILHCPLMPVVDEETGKVTAMVRDTEMAGGKQVQYQGSLVWLYRRNLTAKEVLDHAHRRYPEGAVIASSEIVNGRTYELTVDFGGVLKTGAFTASGAATGLALNLANFLVTISKNAVEGGKARNEAGFKKFGRNQISGIQGQLLEAQKSGLLRRFGKSASSKQGSKIQTSHGVPYLQTEHGLVPVFMLNPNDEIVKAGDFRTGDFASVSRTPMIAKLYGIIVLSHTVSIGHLDCCCIAFGTSNRGDGK